MDNPLNKLELDSSGNVATKPLTGWMTATVGEIAVLLVAEYAESQQALHSGDRKTLQLILTAPQCLALSEKLRTLADKILQQCDLAQKPLN